MSRFSQIAAKVADAIERPLMAPIGIYEVRVTNNPTAVTQTTVNGAFDKVAFALIGVNAVDVDDQAALESCGGAGAVRVNLDFLFDHDDDASSGKSEYRMKTFLTEHLGLDGSLSLGELLSIAKNSQCYAQISHRPDKNDDSVFYYQVNKTMPVG